MTPSFVAFPGLRGTYVLILRLARPAVITVGHLGTFPLAVGWYAYVGSAFGAGGLRGRLKHHLSPAKKLHWHIDYLTAAAPVATVWYCASDIPYEHTWAARLRALPDTLMPIARFGASDCRCPAHLFYSRLRPSPAAIETQVVVQVIPRQSAKQPVSLE